MEPRKSKFFAYFSFPCYPFAQLYRSTANSNPTFQSFRPQKPLIPHLRQPYHPRNPPPRNLHRHAPPNLPCRPLRPGKTALPNSLHPGRPENHTPRLPSHLARLPRERSSLQAVYHSKRHNRTHDSHAHTRKRRHLPRTQDL